MPSVHVLVMAGGSGTRFWPKSRASRPKQLLALWDERSLLEHTIERFAGWVSQERIWVVTTQALVEPSREVIGPKYAGVRFLGEPAAKNTSACICWGAREIAKADPGAVIAVMPADHFIGDEPAFKRAVDAAIAQAQAGAAIVTIGIRPTAPETGYGYIETRAAAGKEPIASPVERFVEKPDRRTAEKYVSGGRHVWNAGMFILSASTAVDAFARTMPSLTQAFSSGTIDEVYARIGKADAVSFDYGVMERAAGAGIPVFVVPSDCGWNDVGSFPALAEIGRAERGDVIKLDASGNVVQSDQGLVALLGVEGLVVVREGDVVLVAAKDRAQDIKSLLDLVKARYPGKA